MNIFEDECPYCGSYNVSASTRIFFLVGIIILGFGILGLNYYNADNYIIVCAGITLLGSVLLFAALITRKDRKCNDCKKVWKKRV